MSPVAAAVASACRADGVVVAAGCVVVVVLGAVVMLPPVVGGVVLAVPPHAAVASTAAAGNRSPLTTRISRASFPRAPERRLNARDRYVTAIRPSCTSALSPRRRRVRY